MFLPTRDAAEKPLPRSAPVITGSTRLAAQNAGAKLRN